MFRYSQGRRTNTLVQDIICDKIEGTEGTLILDFVDRRTHKLVFRGVGQGVVNTSREKNTAAIQDAVNKIVAQFPAAGS